MTKSGMPEGVRVAIGWAVGVTSIALLLVITLILFGNLSGNTGFDDLTSTYTNETGAWLNTTAYTITGASVTGFTGFTVTGMWNYTGGAVIPAANYTINSAAGTFTNATTSEYPSIDVNISYTITYSGQAERNTESVIGNYSESAVNTAAQFPVIGTIVGIALLLVVLIGILVYAVRRMMGLTSAQGTSGGSSFA